MNSLQDQVAIVTGGAKGIGRATAIRLAEEGALLLIADIDTDAAATNAANIRRTGGVAEAVMVDVSEPADIRRVVDRALEQWGRLDILVNNAWNRKEPDGSAVTLTESAWDYAMNTMVKAIFLAAKYAVPHMQTNGGSIVNISSIHGLFTAPNFLAYDTAKSAVIGMTRQMAAEFGPQGIRVNAICPGHIVTERGQARWSQNPSLLRLFEAQYPLRRVGRPEDIANAVRFLCSEEAAFITGHALVVDGGHTIQLQENFGVSMARYQRDNPDTDLPDA